MKRSWVAAGAVVLLAAAGAWWYWGRSPSLPHDPLARVPRNATAVAYVRVGRLLESSLWKRFVTERDAAAGIRRIEQECGFNPIAQLDELVVFALGDEPQSLDHVGVVGRGDLEHRRLAECIGKVVQQDGGEVHQTEIDGVRALAGRRGDSRAAFVGRDGVAIGNERTVRRIIGIVRGDAPSAADDETLERLWKRLDRRPGNEGAGSKRSPGARGPVARDVLLVGHLPAHWRDAVDRYVGDALGGAHSAIRAVGVGLDVEPDLVVELALEMPSEDDARAVLDRVRSQLSALRERKSVRLSPLGPLLRRVKTEASGRTAAARIALNVEDLEDVLALVRERMSRRGDPVEEAAADREPAPPAAAASTPDEVIRRSDD